MTQGSVAGLPHRRGVPPAVWYIKNKRFSLLALCCADPSFPSRIRFDFFCDL
jgi:hypothetical protein